MTEWSGQERLAALVELSADAVVVVDAAGVVRWASSSVFETFGYPPVALVGSPATSLIAPADHAAWRGMIDRLVEHPRACQSCTVRTVHRGGSVRWTEGRLQNLLDDPRVGALVLTFHACGASRDAGEGADRLAQDRYRQLFEDATDFIFETDRDGYFTLVNPATLRMLAAASDAVLGRRFTEFIRADYRPVVFEHYRRQVDARDRASYIEFPAVTSDGREIWLGLNAWLAIDAEGRYLGMRAVARDIGERRRAEEALLHAQKMEAVGRLAGGIAHDFNNLLTAIRGNAELLLHHLRKEPERVADIEAILNAADRAATMTRQLLAFSRNHTLAPVKLDLNGLCDGVGRLARRLIGPGISLEIEPAANLPAVMADAAQLEQLLLNLILNARDALPEGGRITVRTGSRRLPDRTPETARADVPGGWYAVLQVIDNGAGMDPATQARLFEPFFTTKEPGRGTGLGLSTAYGTVRQMGGGITVVSERNRGATFSVFLPAATDMEEKRDA